MEAKPRGSVGRQGRLIIAFSISLNVVLYINRVHRHAHVCITRVCYGARLRCNAPEIMIRHDGGHDPFWSPPPPSSSPSSSARRCEFRTANVRHAYPCPAVGAPVCVPVHVYARACDTSHTTAIDKLPREEHSRAIPELDIRQINCTRAYARLPSTGENPFDL